MYVNTNMNVSPPIIELATALIILLYLNRTIRFKRIKAEQVYCFVLGQVCFFCLKTLYTHAK